MGENNLREKDYVLLSSCLKKTNAARQKSEQIRRAAFDAVKERIEKKEKRIRVICAICGRKRRLRENKGVKFV